MKTEFKDMKEQRTYIRNLVKRKYHGDTTCMKCKADVGSIVHNKVDPYKISFICSNCRVGLKQEDLDAIPKINLLEHIDVNVKYSHSKNLVLDSKLKDIVEGSVKTEKPLMEYLRDNDISWNKFNKATVLYESETGTKIRAKIKRHFNYLRAENIKHTLNSKKN